MEKRLVAQGPRDRKSFTVTLPIDWVKNEGLHKTRVVELTIVGNKIVISPYKDLEKRVLINAEEYADSLIKVLQGFYRIGVGEIKVQFIDADILERILDIIEKKLIGYEVVQQKKDFVVIKDITKESEEDFKTIFRRIFFLLLDLSNSQNMNEIKSFDRNIKKLINYCKRILMKKGHPEFLKVPLYYLLLDRLEKIGDEYVWILAIKTEEKKKIILFREINEIFKIAYELFYKFDAEKYNRYQYRTYLLKNEIKIREKIDRYSIHLHNLTRLLNSLYADIFSLQFDAKNGLPQ